MTPRILLVVPKVYYVIVNGDRVDGPFETHAAAKAVADDRSTHEVNMTYRVEGVEEDDAD